MIILAYILSGLSLLMGIIFLVKPRVSIGFLLVWLPLIAGALSPHWAMLGDAKRAVAWVKENLEKFGVDPDKLVLGGTLQHYTKPVDSGVKAIKIIFAWTDHAFDLLLPKYN